MQASQHWCVHSIRKHCLWVRPYFTRRFQHVLLEWFVRWEVNGRTIAVLFDSASRICSNSVEHWYLGPIRLFIQAFLSSIVQPYSCTDMAITRKNPSFILSERSDFHLIVNLSIAFDAIRLLRGFYHFYIKIIPS